MAHIAPSTTRYHGTVVGNGHCVAYVRAACELGHTSTWRPGVTVRGAGCAPGTAIATFTGGVYGNHTDGRSHTAVLIEETPDGLKVTDQWVGHPVAQRLIRFKGGAGKPVDDGDAYQVIET